jgi:hypothetical protein
MGMRTDWQKAKSTSEFAFKQEKDTLAKNKEKVKTGDVLTSGFEPYPIKFDKKLGPALDDWEKAKDSSKKADAAKRAKTAIDHYESEAKKLKGVAQQVLTTELSKLKKTLGLH